MTAATDTELIQEYAERNSQSAFAELVERHINLVYSVGLRFVGNSHDAEDVTQAVFTILAQKAAGLRQRATLTGWLYETARFAAARLVRTRARQRARDQEAYMQSTTDSPETEGVWRQLAPLLEEAMSRLSEKERALVALRFFENKTGREAAALLGIQESAAHKRASRALEKLRRFFLRRGISSTAALIAGAISANSVHAAPLALTKTVTAAALAKGAVAGSSALTLVEATLLAMKTKTLIASIAAAALVLGTGTYLVCQSRPARASSTPDEVIPVRFANDSFAVPAFDKTNRFVNDIDPGTRRTPDSAPAGHLKCLLAPTSAGPADYLNSVPSPGARGLAASRGVRYVVAKDSKLLGKRVRVTGWIKTRDVRNWAGATLVVGKQGGPISSFDDMSDRAIRGTADWQQVEMIADIPTEPCYIYVAPTLYGPGEIWCDDFQIEIAPPRTPTTGGLDWRVFSPNPPDYSKTTDYNVKHNSHPSLCLSYTSEGAAPKGSWLWWCHSLRPLEKYLGHTVRMSVWLKCENLSGSAGPNLVPQKGDGQNLPRKGRPFHRIVGTTDWSEHIITCEIPTETQSLGSGIYFLGSGKVWVDMQSVKYEIIN